MDLLKLFFIKRKIKYNTTLFDSNKFTGNVERVGVLLNGNQFNESRLMEQNLWEHGIGHAEIEFKIFRKESYVEVEKSANYCGANFTWNGSFLREDIKRFVEKDFDLLISYYNEEDIFLKYLKYLSKAKFKVGMSQVNDPINQLDFDLELNDNSAFCFELKKYITLLKNN